MHVPFLVVCKHYLLQCFHQACINIKAINETAATNIVARTEDENNFITQLTSLSLKTDYWEQSHFHYYTMLSCSIRHMPKLSRDPESRKKKWKPVMASLQKQMHCLTRKGMVFRCLEQCRYLSPSLTNRLFHLIIQLN